MAAPLAVVIPTLDVEKTLPACFEALFEGLFDGLIREVIVTDGGSLDETVAIASALGARVLAGAPGRGGQLRRGCAATAAPWLMVLHADTRLRPGWTGALRRHIDQRPGAAGYFWLRFDVTGPAPALVARWANLRARALGLPFGDQGIVLPGALLRAAGGYPDLPLMEDVALARALRGQLHPIGHVAETSAARYTAEGWLRRGARNLWCQTRYGLGADPEALARAYRRR